MKGINFITTLSPKEQRAMQRWFIATMSVSIVVLLGIGYVQIKQLHRLFEVKKEKTSLSHGTIAFQASSTRKEKLQQQLSMQKKRLAKISKHQTNPKNPHDILMTITDACSKATMQLESFSMHKHAIELTGQCTQPEQALSLINNLNNSTLFQQVTLVSMQPVSLNQEKNSFGLTCTINGILKK
ncbi:MAG: PilN domain-containing protein [bacterium]|nr:PilN domain-containing protein [bacterium]